MDSPSEPAPRTEVMLRWLAERLISEKVVMVCNCGHDLSDHAWGDDGAERPWPCTFPVGYGAPFRLCHCADFTEPEWE